MATQVYDRDGNFMGFDPNLMCNHRPIDAASCWCTDCGCYCMPNSPCTRCQMGIDGNRTPPNA